MQDNLQIQVNETGVDTGSGADIRMSGQNITDAYNQLETNLTNAVNAQLNTIGTNATAKGAMLTPTAPTQGISSYDYNRWVAPNLNATIAGLRETGTITAGLQTLNNMKADAQANYDKALAAAKARAAARAAAAANSRSTGGGTPSDTVAGVTTESTDDPSRGKTVYTEKQKLDMINSLAYDDKLKMIELATKYGWDADKISELNKKYYGSKNSYFDAGNNKAGISVNYGGTYVPAAGGYSVGGGSSNGGSSNTIPFNVFTASIGGI